MARRGRQRANNAATASVAEFVLLLAALLTTTATTLLHSSWLPSAHAFQPLARIRHGGGAGVKVGRTSSPSKPPPPPPPPPTTTTTTQLTGKVWNKLGIDPDPPGLHQWYLLNCIAGSELELLAQLQKIQPTMNPDDVLKFAVPQERKLRSHGSRNVIDVKALYPGYVFAKVRLTPEVYETISKIPLTRSWMGTVHMKGMKRLPVVPVALNEEELEKFKGLDEATDAMFEKYGPDYDGSGDTGQDLIEQYKGYEVDNMVKVLNGKHKGEDAVVKRLKDGKIKVRLYTYGSSFDEWYDPADLRPMTDAEILRGLGGPEGPVNQEQFDISIGKKPKDYGRRGAVDGRNQRSLRSDLMSGLGGRGGGGGRQRMTRADRQARGERGSRDRFGRSREETEQEEKNWREYREQQRREKREGTWGMRGDKPWMYEETQDVTGQDDDEDEGVMSDVDAQWGRGERRMRRPQQQRGQQGRGGRQWQDAGSRRSEGVERALEGDEDWTSFAPGGDGSSSSSSSGKDKDDTDSFFDSLMSELSESLDSPPSPSPMAPRATGGRSLPDDNDGWSPRASSSSRGGTQGAGGPTAPSEEGGTASEEDDFFASLMDDLSDTLDGPSGATSVDADMSSSTPGKEKEDDFDFFSSLEEDLSNTLGAPIGATGESSSPSPSSAGTNDDEDSFFASLQEDLVAPTASAGGLTNDEDSFFASLEEELASTLDGDASDEQVGPMDSAAPATVAPKKTTKKKVDAPTGPPPEPEVAAARDDSGGGDLSKLTVPVLKGMLKERGLKVSGRKAELIDRLRDST